MSEQTEIQNVWKVLSFRLGGVVIEGRHLTETEAEKLVEKLRRLGIVGSIRHEDRATNS